MSTLGVKRMRQSRSITRTSLQALAASVGYHTTIRPCVEGEQQAAEVLNLFGHRGKSMKDLR